MFCESLPLCPIPRSLLALLCKWGPAPCQSMQTCCCYRLCLRPSHYARIRLRCPHFGLPFQYIICDSLTPSLRYTKKIKPCFFTPQKLNFKLPMQVHHDKQPDSADHNSLIRCLRIDLAILIYVSFQNHDCLSCHWCFTTLYFVFITTLNGFCFLCSIIWYENSFSSPLNQKWSKKKTNTPPMSGLNLLSYPSSKPFKIRVTSLSWTLGVKTQVLFEV